MLLSVGVYVVTISTIYYQFTVEFIRHTNLTEQYNIIFD